MNLTVNLTYEHTQDNKLKDNFGIVVDNSKISGKVNNDLFNQQLMNFYLAINKYDETKGTDFSTFLYTFLKSRKNNYIRDNTKKYTYIEKDYLEQIADNIDIENQYIQKESSKDILKEIENLDDKGKFIIKQRIFNEQTFKDISQKLNCSSQNVRQIYYNRVKKIRDRVSN